MSIEQQARFEAWAKSEGYLTVKSHDGRYLAPETNSAEQGWQAALASQPQTPAALVPDGVDLGKYAEAIREAWMFSDLSDEHGALLRELYALAGGKQKENSDV